MATVDGTSGQPHSDTNYGVWHPSKVQNRIHQLKMARAPEDVSGQPHIYTNYVAYQTSNGQERVGHLDIQTSIVYPLSFLSGAPLSNLYQVIEIGEEQISPSGKPFPLSSVTILPPLSGRDVLAVGKNYFEHAIEFNSSGYDSSDKADQPTHPVIFTKRSTSIIAHGEPIFPHPGFTETVDYEGEIGVIIGKSGFRVEEKDAMDYVWGYTIINDVTARERQRDHKQFYIGKSPDTFCPMGPIAVPASKLPKTLRVETHVNGELRQSATTDSLIFSVAFLIKTLSEGQTLQAGDVIATGTPAGVGFGQKPPTFLKEGDLVEVSVTGLGTLANTVSSPSAKNRTVERIQRASHIPVSNLNKSCGGVGLTAVNSKNLYYRQVGVPSGQPIIFIHGLGATSEFFMPLIMHRGLKTSHSLHLLDLEGHGLSPTSAASKISISSYAADVAAIAEHANIKGAIIVAHSMGCLIALDLALKKPGLVSRLVLMGPPLSPTPESARRSLIYRAEKVRSQGMAAIVDSVVLDSTSPRSRSKNPLAIAAVRLSLLGQDPEGYAKGCCALANAGPDVTTGSFQQLSQIEAETVIIAGGDDVNCPLEVVESYEEEMTVARATILGCGRWMVFEDMVSTSDAVFRSIQPDLDISMPLSARATCLTLEE